MSEPTDHELLADYARTGAEPAFGQLVARYINLVHSAARRHAGSEEPAGEITQAVFLILARKAGSLAQGGRRRHTALGGWLYQTARLTAANALKAETRRQLRDHQAYMQSQENQADAAVWREIAPLLDDAMGKLGETDRNVLVLRFFEGRTNAETAAALGLAEGAVQKRVLRALEKLRASFAKQGVTHTAQAIAGTVTTNAVQVAPAGLLLKVSLLAGKGALVTTTIAALVNGTLKAMAWAKAKIATTISLFVLFIVGAASYFDVYSSKWEVKYLNGEVPATLMIRPASWWESLMPGGGSYGYYGKSNSFVAFGRNLDLVSMLGAAYGYEQQRTIFPTNLPANRYFYVVTLPDSPREKFKAVIKKQLGYFGHPETITTNVWILRSTSENKLTVSLWPKSFRNLTNDPTRFINLPTQPIGSLVSVLENEANLPVLDQTGLTNVFDISLEWQWHPKHNLSLENRARLKQAIHDQLGLELIETNYPIEILVVEKVK